MISSTQNSVPIVDPSTVSPSAQRYQIERAWRQVRNGGTATAASREDGQLSVGLRLIGSDRVEPRGDLTKHEKSDRGGDSYVGDETAD